MIKYRDKRKPPVIKNQRHCLAKKRPSVLIVTEGENSEPEYFKLLSKEFNLGYEVTVDNLGSRSAPKNLVNYIKEKILWKRFDYIYCVFDRDTHSTYKIAIDTIRKMNMNKKYGNIKILAITSVPCFEYWLFLHAKYSTKSFSGSSSPCEDLENEMKRHKVFGDYSKSRKWMHSHFKDLKKSRNTAIKYAKSILTDAKRTRVDDHMANPSTYVHLVVEFLHRIQLRRRAEASRIEKVVQK